MHYPFCPLPFWGTTCVKHQSSFRTDQLRTRLHISFFPGGFPVTIFSCPPTLGAIWILSSSRRKEEPLILRIDNRFVWLETSWHQYFPNMRKTCGFLKEIKPWTVNSRVSNHMITDINLFQHFKPSQGVPTIRMVDGSLSKVVWSRSN